MTRDLARIGPERKGFRWAGIDVGCNDMPPTLHTPRLTLTPPTVGDFDDIVALNADPAVVGPIGVEVQSREASWYRLLRYIGHWHALGYGGWTVRARSGAFLGSVGLMDSRRDSSPSFEGAIEVGWAFMPSAHGQGFAREAAEAMLAWADQTGIGRTVCIISPANAASIRLAERLKFERYAEGTYGEKPTLFFERLA